MGSRQLIFTSLVQTVLEVTHGQRRCIRSKYMAQKSIAVGIIHKGFRKIYSRVDFHYNEGEFSKSEIFKSEEKSEDDPRNVQET